MITASPTAPPAASAAPTVTSAAPRGRRRIVAGALAVAAAVAAVNLLARPLAAADVDRYEAMAPERDSVWAAALIGGFAAAVAYVTVGLAVCLLVPRRGARWATAGAVLATLGGILFCAGFFAWGAVSWYATSEAAAGDGLFAFFQDESWRAFGPQIAGFALASLGVLALAVALWRAGTVPRWIAVAPAVMLLVMFASGTGVAYDTAHALYMATFVAVAWCLWRTR